MAFAQGNRNRLSIVPEVTFGTAPTNPALKVLPVNTHSLNLSKDRVAGNEIQSDRMTRVDRHGNRQASGDIVVDLRADDFDALLESAMFSTWDDSPSAAPDKLKVGVTPKFFTIEDAQLDISQYRLFTGMAVSSAAISIAPNQMVTATFSMMGKNMTIGATTYVLGSGSLTPATTNQPFDSYSGDLLIADFGSSLGAITTVTGIDFTINNSLAPTFVVGSDTAPQLEFGRAEIEGTITAYFEDASLINRFLAETEAHLSVAVNDPTDGNEYKFYFPRIKINSADTSVDNPQSRIITMSFVALYDTTENTNLLITRPDSNA
jgi:hypothetical protein